MSPVELVSTAPDLPERTEDAHKGDMGKVLVLAGSLHYTGAAILAARATLRAGAGVVTLACPESVHAQIASRLLCEISYPLPAAAPGVFSRDGVSEALDLTEHADVVALGPGLTTEPTAQDFARDMAQLCPVPMVIDADGLNAFAARAGDLSSRPAARIVTPHPGEAGRMLGWTVAKVRKDREATAVELARAVQGVVLLKGAGTLVTDGQRLYRNATGNPGMATAGAGDVLTGVVAALLGQGMSPFDAACLGAYLHGLAGDLAAEEFGRHSTMASDILDALPAAFLRHGSR